MTNGERLQKIFPNLEYEILSRTVLTNIDNEAWFSLDWWNAEYKEPTKNDLEIDVPDNNVGNIDCISREQAKAAIRNRFKDLPSRVEINTILNELSPVTPQEPRKGHWISYNWNDNGIVRWGIKCDKCHKKYKYGGEIMWDNPNFCPNCGSDNREVEE